MARTPYRILWLLLALAFLRHLWIALYVHPYADDFSYAVAGMRSPLLERLAQEYDSWNGRYFSNILVLRNPLVLGMDQGLWPYRMVAIALMLFSWVACFSLLRALVDKALRKDEVAAVSLVSVLLYLHIMPDASEGFYWYSGAVTYQLPNALGFFLLANWVRYFRAGGGRPRRSWVIVQVLLVIVIAGCNELHMAYLVLFHAGLIVLSLYTTRRVANGVVIPFIASVLCGLVVALAPGNATRGALFPFRYDLVHTLLYSSGQTGRFTARWLSAVPMLLLTIAFIVFRRKLLALGSIASFGDEVNKWLVLALPFTIVFVAMVVTYWPTGLLGQHRTLNAALFYFLPAWFFAVSVWDDRLLRPRGSISFDVTSPYFQWGLVAVCASFLVAQRDWKVTEDLVTGRMQRYDRAICQRYDLIQRAVQLGSGRVELPAIEAPESLHILPLDLSPDHWMNRSMADYFGNPQLDLIVSPLPPVATE